MQVRPEPVEGRDCERDCAPLRAVFHTQHRMAWVGCMRHHVRLSDHRPSTALAAVRRPVRRYRSLSPVSRSLGSRVRGSGFSRFTVWASLHACSRGEVAGLDCGFTLPRASPRGVGWAGCEYVCTLTLVLDAYGIGTGLSRPGRGAPPLPYATMRVPPTVVLVAQSCRIELGGRCRHALCERPLRFGRGGDDSRPHTFAIPSASRFHRDDEESRAWMGETLRLRSGRRRLARHVFVLLSLCIVYTK